MAVLAQDKERDRPRRLLRAAQGRLGIAERREEKALLAWSGRANESLDVCDADPLG
jgi:hypothetical protein